MAFTKSTQARHLLFPTKRQEPSRRCRLRFMLRTVSLAPPRFDPGLSTGPGSFATRDLGVSPDRTHTGWLSRASRSVTS